MVEPVGALGALAVTMYGFSEHKKAQIQKRREDREQEEKDKKERDEQAKLAEKELSKKQDQAMKHVSYSEGNNLVKRLCERNGLSTDGGRKQRINRLLAALGWDLEQLTYWTKVEQVAEIQEKDEKRQAEEDEERTRQQERLAAMQDEGTATLYKVLECRPNATKSEIRRAYQKQALRNHPDKNPGNQEEATKKFQLIGLAYETLSDPEKRAEYDEDPEGYLRRQKGGKDGVDLAADMDARFAKTFLKEVLVSGLREAQAKNPLLGLALGAVFNVDKFQDALDDTIEDGVEMWNTIPPKQRKYAMELVLGIFQ
jgi:hypothetical protein